MILPSLMMMVAPNELVCIPSLFFPPCFFALFKHFSLDSSSYIYSLFLTPPSPLISPLIPFVGSDSNSQSAWNCYWLSEQSLLSLRIHAFLENLWNFYKSDFIMQIHTKNFFFSQIIFFTCTYEKSCKIHSGGDKKNLQTHKREKKTRR